MKYNVMMASDANYLPYVEITLKSLLMHNENLSVFILHTGIFLNRGKMIFNLILLNVIQHYN
ncbi:hypothetical protein [Haemophilus influenzae]|uniref:hypothetical protein n=1 Tax=Haemophilus influenzae TaxID=727 RepID=UPI0021BDCEF1|nr:hypothetical protein [Haemophilus influenzae]